MLESINLASITFLGHSFHKKISKEKEENPQSGSSEFLTKAQKQEDTLEEGKVESEYQTEKSSAVAGTSATVISEKRENVRFLIL